MSKNPEPPKSRRALLTGAAKPVRGSDERIREFLKDRPEPSASAAKQERKKFQMKRREAKEPDDKRPAPHSDDADGGDKD